MFSNVNLYEFMTSENFCNFMKLNLKSLRTITDIIIRDKII